MSYCFTQFAAFGIRTTMAFTHIFVFVIFAFSVDALKWKNCDGSSPVKIGAINISPHPLELRAGKTATFSGRFTVSGAAGTNYKIDVSLWKSGWWGTWIPIPCFGQCTRDIGCHQLVGSLEGAECPLPHGTYVVGQKTHTLPDISIPSFIMNGKFKIRGDLRDRGNNRRISCVEAEVEISS